MRACQQDDTVVGLDETPNDRSSIVARFVVDHHDCKARMVLSDQRRKTAADIGGLVPDRHDDRDAHPRVGLIRDT
jgi:hypothetical protein